MNKFSQVFLSVYVKEALSIVIPFVGMLVLALLVLLFVSLYRKKHGYPEKKQKEDSNSFWTNPYRFDGDEENGGTFEIDAIEDGEALYCRRCGKKLPKDSLFCQHCGTKVIAG